MVQLRHHATYVAFIVSTALYNMHAVNACGNTLASANFDSFPGAFSSWSEDKARAALTTGDLKWIGPVERASVGEGVLRVQHPQGSPLAGFHFLHLWVPA